jgi:hypothetical protein
LFLAEEEGRRRRKGGGTDWMVTEVGSDIDLVGLWRVCTYRQILLEETGTLCRSQKNRVFDEHYLCS